MNVKLDNFNTYEDALTKVLQIEIDEDYPVNPVNSLIEEQLEIMQKSIREISLKGHEFWCTKFSMTEHTKYYCPHEECRQDIQFIQSKCFCNICQENDLHAAKDCPYNMKNLNVLQYVKSKFIR